MLPESTTTIGEEVEDLGGELPGLETGDCAEHCDGFGLFL
jgi:hypothetical protein